MWSVFFKSFSIVNKKLTPLLTLEREFLNTKNLPPPKIAIHMVHFLKKKKKKTEKCKLVATPEGVVLVVLVVVRFIRELT
jgi:hypothetical protein